CPRANVRWTSSSRRTSGARGLSIEMSPSSTSAVWPRREFLLKPTGMAADQRDKGCRNTDEERVGVARLRDWTRVVERGLNPAATLIGRLRFSQKFLLIGLVLVAPLAYVVFSYLGVQSRDTSFAAKERVGVVYLRP